MNSDPLNNNKGTRTHPSLERSTSSFSEKERKFVLSNSYWFLFSFFLSFTIDRRKNVHRLFFFLFIDRRLFSDDRSVVVPLPREIHLCFLPLSRVENRWCVAYRDVSPRDTTDRLFSRGNNRSIWTRLSKNFEGWKLIIIMLSIVFFFFTHSAPSTGNTSRYESTPVYSPWKRSSSRAGRVVSLLFLSWIIGWSLNANVR